MTIKMHIAASGKSSGLYVPCTAEYKCRLGGEDEHMFFESTAEADEYNQLKTAEEYGRFPGDFSKRDKDRMRSLEVKSELIKISSRKYPSPDEPATLANIGEFISRNNLSWGLEDRDDVRIDGDNIFVFMKGEGVSSLGFYIPRDSSMGTFYKETLHKIDRFNPQEKVYEGKVLGAIKDKETEEMLLKSYEEDKKQFTEIQKELTNFIEKHEVLTSSTSSDLPSLDSPATLENTKNLLENSDLSSGSGGVTINGDNLEITISGPNDSIIFFTVPKDSSMETVYEKTLQELENFDATGEFYTLRDEGLLEGRDAEGIRMDLDYDSDHFLEVHEDLSNFFKKSKESVDENWIENKSIPETEEELYRFFGASQGDQETLKENIKKKRQFWARRANGPGGREAGLEMKNLIQKLSKKLD